MTLVLLRSGSSEHILPDEGQRAAYDGKKLRPQCECCMDKDRVPWGRGVNTVRLQSDSARIASAHRVVACVAPPA